WQGASRSHPRPVLESGALKDRRRVGAAAFVGAMSTLLRGHGIDKHVRLVGRTLRWPMIDQMAALRLLHRFNQERQTRVVAVGPFEDDVFRHLVTGGHRWRLPFPE